MLAINCPHCPHSFVLASVEDRPPPWCPRCGSDLKARAPDGLSVPAVADAACQRWNERAAPTTAVTTSLGSVDSLQVEASALPVHPAAETRRPPHLYAEPLLRPQPSGSGPRAAAPAWASLFAVACGIIPLMTLGGALPTAIGVGGASGCLAVARNPQIDTTTRVSICAVITVGCWASVFVLINGLMHMIW